MGPSPSRGEDGWTLTEEIPPKGKAILSISPHDAFPATSGTERRIQELHRRMVVTRPVTLIFPREKPAELDWGEGEIAINLPWRWAKLFSPRMLWEAIRIDRTRGFCCIFCHTLIPGLMGIVLKSLTGKPLVIDEHNAEHVRFRRCGKRLWRLVRIYESIVCRWSDQVISVSHEDLQFLLDLGLERERILVAPNGFDGEVFHPDESRSRRAREDLGIGHARVVLFFGNYRYGPNAEAARIIVDHILPAVTEKLPDTLFLLAGRNPPSERTENDNLRFLGEVPRIEEVIGLADLVICPIVSGGGIRLKILESVACGKRVVSTSMGAEGLDRDALGGNLHLVDGWRAFSERVVNLLEEDWRDSVPPGFAEKYGWDTIYRNRVMPILEGLCGSDAP